MNRMLASLSLLPLLAVSVPATAAPATEPAKPATRHPITHEDVWLMKRPGTPAPSPDGRWVVFSVSEPAYDDDKKSSDLWLAPADGSAPPRRLTATRAGESDLAWRPDSAALAFVAKREGDEDNLSIVVIDV